MRSVAEDIVALLTSSLIVSPAFVGKLPHEPDLAIGVVDGPGQDGEAAFVYDRPTAQLTIRGNRGDYPSGYTLAQTVSRHLTGNSGVANVHGQITIGGSRYIGIWKLGDLASLGEDEQKRWRFVLNLRIHRTDAVE